MEEQKLKEILERHKLWLKGKAGGECANLQSANLQNAKLQNTDLRYIDLRYAHLQGANLQNTDLRYAKLRYTNLHNTNLRCTNLQGANLQNANLQNANLQGANLDYSCFPLWCGSKNLKVDERLPLMLAAFICSMECESQDVLEMQTMLIEFAKKSHRAKDILGE